MSYVPTNHEIKQQLQEVTPMGVELAKRVIGCRHDKGWSQKVLSDVTGISRDRLSKIEMGVTPSMRDAEIEAMSKAFDVDGGYFKVKNDIVRDVKNSNIPLPRDSFFKKNQENANSAIAISAEEAEKHSIIAKAQEDSSNAVIARLQTELDQARNLISFHEQAIYDLKRIIISLSLKETLSGVHLDNAADLFKDVL